MLQSVRGFEPKLASSVFMAPSAQVIGDVEIGEQSSIWYNVVLRGDVMPIRIGKRTNVQDGAIVHGTFEKAGVQIGDDVTIGHGAILHGCTIDDLCLIGMGSVLLDNCHIPKNSFVGAGSLVSPGSTFESGQLILGRPAKAVRPLKPEELEFLTKSAQGYIEYTSWYE